MGRRSLALALVCAAAAIVAVSTGHSDSGLLGKQDQVYVVKSTAGKVARVTNSPRGALDPAWSPSGQRLAYVSGTSVVIATTAGRTLAHLSSPGGFFADPPAWSPDGRRLAVTAVAASEVAGKVITVGADGRGRHTVARIRAGTADSSRGPVWSPDGRQLAFCLQGPETAEQGGVRASGELNLAVATADGSGPRTITTAPGSEYGPAWAPDGKTILYVGAAPNKPGSAGARLRLVPAKGGRSTTVIALGEDADASWSPDGRLIAFAGRLPGEPRARLYVVHKDGSGLRRLTGEIRVGTPAWSPDGKEIAFATYGGTIEAIRPDGSGHRTVASLRGGEIGDLAWSPDGKTIAFDARQTPPES